MRTQEEIVKRIEERIEEDFFGFETSDYISRLSFENAKQFLKEGVKSDEWKLSNQDPIDELKEYMSFAWDKANNCRGISAGRNISHIIAWLWLADHEIYNEVKRMNEEEYQYYGKDILKYVCDNFDIDSSVYDDGIRSNTEY